MLITNFWTTNMFTKGQSNTLCLPNNFWETIGCLFSTLCIFIYASTLQRWTLSWPLRASTLRSWLVTLAHCSTNAINTWRLFYHVHTQIFLKWYFLNPGLTACHYFIFWATVGTLLDNRTIARPGLTHWIVTQAEAVIVILRYHKEQKEDNKQFELLEH